MSVSELVRLIKLPQNPPLIPGTAWPRMEARLGTLFPNDFKECLTVLGPGTFNDFLHLVDPFSVNSNLNTSDRLAKLHEAERLSRLNFPKDPVSLFHPFSLHPESPGLIPWGITDNGDDLFWHTLGSPDEWPVVVYKGRDGEYESHPMPMTIFLSSLLSGRLRVHMFPEDFLMHPPEFSPVPDRHAR